MDTLISKIDVDNIDMEEIKKQAEILRAGETVIFPTETVYGLGANALDEEAVSKIYKAKGRPSDNPLIVHIGDKKQVYNLVQSVTKEAEIVMDKFWPGPITIILNKKDIIPKRTSGGLNTVAIRMPSNKIANALIKEANIPIAAPSANISGRPSPTRAKHVYEEMNHRVSGIIMGNDCVYGLESTVLDLTGEIPTILRPGSITKEQLEKELGNVQLDAALEKKEDNIKAKAPGMKYTHYSPNAEVYIVSGEQTNVIDKINTLTEENNDKNLKTCVICLKCNEKQYIGKTICLGETLEDVASNLFDALIQADEEKCDIIYWYCIVSSHDGGIITRRKFNMKTKVNTKSLVILGLMTALTMIFSFTPIGSIPIGPLVITLNVIPIAIAAVTVGPVGSAVIGGVFGLLSFLQCFGIGVPSGMGAALVAIDPVLAFVQRFVPRLLDGIIVGFIAKGMSKVTNNYVSYAVTGFFTAFLNTAFFMSALVLLFGNTDYVKELMGGKNIIVFICTFVGINALVEMAVCTFVTGTVGAALYKARFIPSKNKAQA